MPGPTDRLWVVVQPGGNRHYLDKEPLEGIEAWATGVNATVLEYRLSAVIHRPKKTRR